MGVCVQAKKMGKTGTGADRIAGNNQKNKGGKA